MTIFWKIAIIIIVVVAVYKLIKILAKKGYAAAESIADSMDSVIDEVVEEAAEVVEEVADKVAEVVEVLSDKVTEVIEEKIDEVVDPDKTLCCGAEAKVEDTSSSVEPSIITGVSGYDPGDDYVKVVSASDMAVMAEISLPKQVEADGSVSIEMVCGEADTRCVKAYIRAKESSNVFVPVKIDTSVKEDGKKTVTFVIDQKNFSAPVSIPMFDTDVKFSKQDAADIWARDFTSGITSIYMGHHQKSETTIYSMTVKSPDFTMDVVA